MTRLLIAVVLASVFLVGSALMAQNRAPYFTVGEIEVKDEAAYKAWLPEVRKHVGKAGGRYVAGGFDKTTTLVGTAPPNRVVIIVFANINAWKKWWKDVGEQDIKNAEPFATFRIFGVEGFEH